MERQKRFGKNVAVRECAATNSKIEVPRAQRAPMDLGFWCTRSCSPPVPRQEGEIRTKGMHCMIFLAFVLFVLIWFGFQGGTLKRPCVELHARRALFETPKKKHTGLCSAVVEATHAAPHSKYSHEETDLSPRSTCTQR